MPKSGTSGSVRGAVSNDRPYRDIELIARVSALGSGLLIAVEIEPDEFGRYRIASMYPVSQKKIDNRREAGTLLIVKQKAPR